ncbi:hypothetical protein BDF19DRAFT_411282 [Syncephalis fuscata]|nr:hypothetical protein BDF19DRAFT_411282 [Syncephalis fuscata]
MPINSNASTKKKSFYKKKGRQTGGKSREFAVKNDVKSLSELPQSTSGQLCQLPVAFTHDARMFFGSTDQEVRFFSVATGQMTRVLSKRIEDYHTAPLSAAILNHASPDQLLTSALDGQIKVWNYEDQTC